MFEVDKIIETERSIPCGTYPTVLEVFKNGSCLAVGSTGGIFYFEIKSGKSLGVTSFSLWSVPCIKNMPLLNCLVTVRLKKLIFIHYNENFRVEYDVLEERNVLPNHHGICVEDDMVYYLKINDDHVVVFNYKTRKIEKTVIFDDFNDGASRFRIYNDSSVWPKHLIVLINTKIKITDKINFSILAETTVSEPRIIFDYKMMFAASIGKNTMDEFVTSYKHIQFTPSISKNNSNLSISYLEGEILTGKEFSVTDEQFYDTVEPICYYGKDCLLGLYHYYDEEDTSCLTNCCFLRENGWKLGKETQQQMKMNLL